MVRYDTVCLALQHNLIFVCISMCLVQRFPHSGPCLRIIVITVEKVRHHQCVSPLHVFFFCVIINVVHLFSTGEPFITIV